MTQVLIADDHPIILAGIRSVLADAETMEATAVAQSFDELMAVLQAAPADVLVLDLGGLGMSPLRMVRQIRSLRPAVAIVIFSSMIDLAPELIKIGVQGYVTKENMITDLCAAIRAVAAGGTFLSADVQQYVDAAATAPKHRHELLGPREQEVLSLLVQGSATTDIAAQMQIDPRTVQNYITRLLRKLRCHNRAQLVTWYQRWYAEETASVIEL